MAEKDTPRGDNWVDRLVEDPANPPQVQVLTGYRGRSAQEGHTRLYFDPELTGWVDIPDDAILLTRETQDEQGLGRTLIWTRLDAQVQTGPQAADAGTGAEWFQGQVAQDLGAGAGVGAGINLPRTQLCPSQLAICRTQLIVCRTQQLTCPTTLRTACCPTQWNNWCPPSPIQVCPPTRLDPLCKTIGIACIPTRVLPCPGPVTVDFQCQFTSNPQICNQVATPNPECIPIDIPGTPVFQTPVFQTPGFGDFGQFGGFGQQVQGFGGEEMGVQATQFCPQAHTQICPQAHTQICPGPFRTVQVNCVRRTIFEPQCLRRTIFEPHCFQEIPDWRWQITTPQLQFTPNLGDFGQFGGGGFGQGFEAQGEMGAQATQICPQPQTAFCPIPVTRICPVPITRNIQCIWTPVCPRTLTCPRTPFCPVTPQCPWGGPGGGGDPWGGGGGFGGGF